MTGEGINNPYPHSRFLGLIPGGGLEDDWTCSTLWTGGQLSIGAPIPVFISGGDFRIMNDKLKNTPLEAVR